MSKGAGRSAVTLLCLLGLLLAPSTASAISAPIHIANTGGEGVFIRPDPNTSRPPIGWMPEGASPDYHCFAWGQNINGVPIWFNVTYNGVTGYYASYYDDSSYHSNEELTAKYGVPLCGSAPSSPAPTPAPPQATPTPGASGGSGRIYSIVDADGGIYFRNSPNWGDTLGTPGVGVYTGDRVEVICGLFGEAHGPYANRWWSYVANLSRPSAGKGWVNAHYINDGMPANQPSPGEPSCSSTVAGTSPPAPGRAAFYTPSAGQHGLSIGDLDIPYSQWATGDCTRFQPPRLPLPASINTLAGWSNGRLGPFYYMHNEPAQWSRIHTIILFDPGYYAQMDCDRRLSKPSINEILVSWLQTPGNEFLVLAGKDTEDWTHSVAGVVWGEAKFTGLWNYYLHGLWYQPQSVRARAIICDYNKLGHDDVLNLFYPIVKATALGFRPEGCPISPSAPNPIRWSP
jgi:hypothetical protein